jgi:(4S)-4-hydroxy-5-phosphonooxypentane-2,3-dione isomerase
MHIVSITLTVKPELIDEFERAALLNARTSVAQDPGCLRFDVSQSYDNPGVWVFYEVYDSPEAHAAHRQAPHFFVYQEVEGRAVVEKHVIRAAGKFLKT